MIMLIRRLLAVGLLASFSSAAFWRIGVGKSRLEVQSEKTHFPTVSGFNLERKELVLPRDLAGKLNILFVPFQRQHQATVDTWIPFAREMEATYDEVAHYELPTIDEMPMLSRTFLNEGMRAGIPDPVARERTITLYIDTAKFRQATGIPNRNEVHILLVNREGDILWRTTGRHNDEKAESLWRAIAENR
jgi:hypothetical protein